MLYCQRKRNRQKQAGPEPVRQGGFAVKKLICFALVLSAVLFLCAGALAYDRSGSFYAPITASFCSGESDRYAFWTKNAEQAGLLTVLIAQDLMRQNYTDYNYCFPIDTQSCVTYNSGSHSDRDIHVIYMCFDAYLVAYYDADTGMVRYWIDKQNPDVDYFVRNYVSTTNNGYHRNIFWNMDTSMVFPEPTSAFSSAFSKWNRYLEQHPELAFSQIGW